MKYQVQERSLITSDRIQQQKMYPLPNALIPGAICVFVAMLVLARGFRVPETNFPDLMRTVLLFFLNFHVLEADTSSSIKGCRASPLALSV